jgi:hypothetical protein
MSLYRSKVVVHVPDPAGGTFKTRLADLPKVSLRREGKDLILRVPGSRVRSGFPGAPTVPWYRHDRGETRELRGEDAIRAAGAILPRMNQSGGSRAQVQSAVALLEHTPNARDLFVLEATALESHNDWTGLKVRKPMLKELPAAARLALEMAAHEETERRALEGELHVLEAAWRDAEEIAHIADDMFLPASVEEELARLKRLRDGGTPERPR